jgi:type II secretory pathway pseudopilin PulG
MRRAFTLVEVIIAFTIFTVVITLVLVSMVQTFKSFHQGEKFADSIQRQRVFFQKMARNIQSLVAVEEEGKAGFEALQVSFAFVTAQADVLAEVRYAYNGQTKTIDRFIEQPADFDFATWGTQDVPSLEGVAECMFWYGNASNWQHEWRQESSGIPAMVKVEYRMRDDQEKQEFTVHIPVSR